MKNTMQIGAILNSISFTRDGGLRMGFVTQELNEEHKLIAQRFYQKYGYLLFKENEFQYKEVPKGNVEDKNKTPSKRLRAALYVLHQQTKSNEDFELFYRAKMEKLINMVKAKLD